MHVGVCIIDLRLPGNGSLKGKRRVVKSIVTRITREFNVSVAEVVQWIEAQRFDVELLDYQIELL